MRIQKVGEFLDERGLPYVEPVDSKGEARNCISSFWSIYVRNKNGLEYCVGDYKTEEDAKSVLKMIEEYYANL